MKYIHYAGDILLTGSDIADALVHYAEALARRDTSSAVEIPVRYDDGRIKTVTVLIGPASQIIAVPEDSDYAEIIDEELVAEFNGRAAKLGDSRPRHSNDAATAGTMDDYEIS